MYEKRKDYEMCICSGEEDKCHLAIYLDSETEEMGKQSEKEGSTNK